MFTYASETWPQKRNIIIKIRVLRIIYSPDKDNGIRISKYKRDFHKLYNKPDNVKVIEIGRLRQMEHDSAL
jgi:hypothetical protein